MPIKKKDKNLSSTSAQVVESQDSCPLQDSCPPEPEVLLGAILGGPALPPHSQVLEVTEEFVAEVACELDEVIKKNDSVPCMDDPIAFEAAETVAPLEAPMCFGVSFWDWMNDEVNMVSEVFLPCW